MLLEALAAASIAAAEDSTGKAPPAPDVTVYAPERKGSPACCQGRGPGGRYRGHLGLGLADERLQCPHQRTCPAELRH